MKNLFISLLLSITAGAVCAQNVGIGTTTPAYPLTVVSGSNSQAIDISNTASGSGIKANSNSSAPTIRSVNNSAGYGIGVFGTTPGNYNSSTADSGSAAVRGEITAVDAGDFSTGVLGINRSSDIAGIGVIGINTGLGIGVFGEADSDIAVYGSSVVGYGGYFSSINGTGLVTYGGAGPGLIVQGAGATVCSFRDVGYVERAKVDQNGKGYFLGGIQISDGTEGTGKVLTAVDNSGNATWQNVSATLSLPYSGTSSNLGNLFSVTGTSNATAIYGSSASAASGTPSAGAATAVLGELTATSGGGYSAAVRGLNRSTTGSGIGVVGYQAGSGWGVYGETASGRGIYGYSTSGVGGFFGTSTGLALQTSGGLKLTGIGETAGYVLGTDASGNASWQSPIALPYSGTSSNLGNLFSVTASSNGTAIYGSSASAASGTPSSGAATAVLGELTATSGGSYSAAVRGLNRSTTSSGIGVLGYVAGGGWGVYGESASGFGVYANTNTGTGLLAATNSGANIALFLAAGANKARIDNSGKGFFDGGTQNSGADLAESFAVEGARNNYEPGDVLAISTGADRTVTKSTGAYSKLVVGVYATKPGVLLTEKNIEVDLSGDVPMGVVGVIPTKVCNEGGAIHRGDMLVTSSKPGYAMKADEDKIKPGMLIGKALADMTGEEGLIEVMVNVR